jgi:hypothetical protein
MMKKLCAVALFLVSVAASAQATPPVPFRFEAIKTIAEMQAAISMDFSPGAPRSSLRQRFVAEGAATQKVHPSKAGVEKYIYDINLCRYYIWRWNISADYDSSERLLQAYVNGEPIFASGPQKPDLRTREKKGAKAAILKVMRARPEATKGENVLTHIVLDADGDPATRDDQVAMGGGPTRADPLNMGVLHVYTNIDPWRSIFDADAADRIVDYQDDCNKVDEAQSRRKAGRQ